MSISHIALLCIEAAVALILLPLVLIIIGLAILGLIVGISQLIEKISCIFSKKARHLHEITKEITNEITNNANTDSSEPETNDANDPECNKSAFSIFLKIYSVIIAILILTYSILLLFQIFDFVFSWIFSTLLSLSTYVSTYLSLTATLLVCMYIPEKVYMWPSFIIDVPINLFKKYIKKEKENIQTGSQSQGGIILRKIKLKKVVYAISILITVLQSIELLANKIVLNNIIWLNIKPVVFQTIVTVLCFDKFFSMFSNKVKITKGENNKNRRQ